MARWATVAEFPDYEVSDDGRVRRVTRGRHTHVGRELTPYVTNKGYFVVCPSGVRRSVHRLVATAFLPNPLEHPQVNHINGTPADNRAENLYWGTQSQNLQDRARHGRQPRALTGWARTIGMDQARAMRAEYTGARGEIARLADKYGVSPYVAGYIVRGQTYREDGENIRPERALGLNDFQRRVVVRLKGRMSSAECAHYFPVSSARIRQIWRAAA